MLGQYMAPYTRQVVIEHTNNSYDLELDKKLAEETTVLVENYTVSLIQILLPFGL